MKDVNSELQRLSGELQRLKQHNKETKRLIKDCFLNSHQDDNLLGVWRWDYNLLLTHVNKRKL